MHSANLPVAVAFGSALLWGAWWMPVRLLEAAGMTGGWVGVLMIGCALPLLLAVRVWTGPPRTPISVRLAVSGALIGGAMALYTAAITETSVVRAVLIFYLAPVWSILIEVTWLGRRLRWLNGLAFGMAALGLLTIFRFDLSVSGWAIGDSIALVSGMCWAAGSALVFTGSEVRAARLATWGCVGGVAVSVGVNGLFATPTPPLDQTLAALPTALATGTLYIAPVLIATLWSARRLSPTTLSFLLTGEILAGVATAAWLLDEPFGWPEVTGAALIVAAALIEVVLPKPAAPGPAGPTRG